MKNIYVWRIFLFALCISSMPAIAQETLVPKVTQWVKDNNKKLRLQSNDLVEMKVSSASSKDKLTFAYIQQYYLGLKVHNAIYSICFDSKGGIVSNSSRFVDKINTKATSAIPSISAMTAVAKAAAYLKLNDPVSLTVLPDQRDTATYLVFTPAGIAKQNILAELLWVTTNDGKTIQLAWNITIDVLHSSDYMNVRVNALNGQIINADNSTLYEKNNSVRKNRAYQTPIKTSPLLNN
ncbi:MAG TPA: hypothetical protein VK559_10805, partial [Ferruginibacter sp.]|nr:hypothetical protein [Ferruginibacter sp.]